MILATIATEEYRDLREISFPNKKAYCDRHGHTFVGFMDPIHRARPVSWSKIKLLEMLAFQHQKGWAFWSDADALITRLDWNVEELIEPDVDLIGCRDAAGFLTGSFLIQLNGAGRQFLIDIYDRIQFMYHRDREAAAMEDLLSRGYRVRVKYVDKALIDASPEEFREGYSAVVHVSGRPLAERAEELRKWGSGRG
jgi:hypothetical protein